MSGGGEVTSITSLHGPIYLDHRSQTMDWLHDPDSYPLSLSRCAALILPFHALLYFLYSVYPRLFSLWFIYNFPRCISMSMSMSPARLGPFRRAPPLFSFLISHFVRLDLEPSVRSNQFHTSNNPATQH